MTYLRFTPEKFQDFKKAYYEALLNQQESFVFEGNEFVLSYAKYVIEYLTSKLNEQAR